MDKAFLKRTIRGSAQVDKMFEGRSDEEMDAFAERMAEELVNNWAMVVRGQLNAYGADLTVRVTEWGGCRSIEVIDRPAPIGYRYMRRYILA